MVGSHSHDTLTVIKDLTKKQSSFTRKEGTKSRSKGGLKLNPLNGSHFFEHPNIFIDQYEENTLNKGSSFHSMINNIQSNNNSSWSIADTPPISKQVVQQPESIGQGSEQAIMNNFKSTPDSSNYNNMNDRLSLMGTNIRSLFKEENFYFFNKFLEEETPDILLLNETWHQEEEACRPLPNKEYSIIAFGSRWQSWGRCSYCI